jgi:hypothetical protein
MYMLSPYQTGKSKIEKKVFKQKPGGFLLDKNGLGEGISHITVFNQKQKPVCERLYFKRRSRNLM